MSPRCAVPPLPAVSPAALRHTRAPAARPGPQQSAIPGPSADAADDPLAPPPPAHLPAAQHLKPVLCSSVPSRWKCHFPCFRSANFRSRFSVAAFAAENLFSCTMLWLVGVSSPTSRVGSFLGTSLKSGGGGLLSDVQWCESRVFRIPPPPPPPPLDLDPPRLEQQRAPHLWPSPLFVNVPLSVSQPFVCTISPLCCLTHVVPLYAEPPMVFVAGLSSLGCEYYPSPNFCLPPNAFLLTSIPLPDTFHSLFLVFVVLSVFFHQNEFLSPKELRLKKTNGNLRWRLNLALN